jgi:hypothetical protein
MRAGRDTTGRIGTIECRAVLTLYSLLTEHPVDQWGRCQSCRQPGWMLVPRWWPCRVSSKAELYLQRVDEVLLQGMLTDNLGLDTAPPPLGPGPAVPVIPEDTDLPPTITADPATTDPGPPAPASPQVHRGGAAGSGSRRDPR